MLVMYKGNFYTFDLITADSKYQSGWSFGTMSLQKSFHISFALGFSAGRFPGGGGVAVKELKRLPWRLRVHSICQIFKSEYLGIFHVKLNGFIF